jgi:hypothetical protein
MLASSSWILPMKRNAERLPRRWRPRSGSASATSGPGTRTFRRPPITGSWRGVWSAEAPTPECLALALRDSLMRFSVFGVWGAKQEQKAAKRIPHECCRRLCASPGQLGTDRAGPTTTISVDFTSKWTALCSHQPDTRRQSAPLQLQWRST